VTNEEKLNILWEERQQLHARMRELDILFKEQQEEWSDSHE
jgi:hypothetical protein